MGLIMDWTLVRSFLTTAETGSLSAAARRLGLTQPTLGRHIQELEQSLGVVLFIRSQRGLEPTSSGEELIETARAMREAAEAFERQATGRAEAVAGSVRITASEMVATFLLPDILLPIRLAHPEIQFEIEATNAIGNLTRRDADIAIRMVRPTQPDLIARRVNTMAVGLFGATSYLDRRGRPRSAADLASHDLIGLDRNDTIIRGFAAGGLPVERSRFVLRSDDQIVGWSMMQAGLGLAFGPSYLRSLSPGIEQLELSLRVPALEMWLASHREVTTSRRMRLVVDGLAEGLSALPLSG
jgi:DNA-binding transcriptional LysR family regulator